MPYSNLPEADWPKMDRCVAKLQDEGRDKESAIAICYTSISGNAGKAAELYDALKIGARHSRADSETLQAMHDYAVKLGAVCGHEEKSLPQDALIYYGGEVKALGGGRVGGYLVRFSTPSDPDLTGDFFTKQTDFGNAQQTDVLYHHGLDPQLGGRVIGRGALKTDDVGVWVEAQLNMRDQYEKAIYEMAKAGKLGWSSGTAPHRVDREQKGGAQWVKSWPLGLDASLTPTPAEPRNSAFTLKSLLPASKSSPEMGSTHSVKPRRVFPRKG